MKCHLYISFLLLWIFGSTHVGLSGVIRWIWPPHLVSVLLVEQSKKVPAWHHWERVMFFSERKQGSMGKSDPANPLSRPQSVIQNWSADRSSQWERSWQLHTLSRGTLFHVWCMRTFLQESALSSKHVYGLGESVRQLIKAACGVKSPTPSTPLALW